MRTIKDLQELADKKAYCLIKNGPDDYNLKEKYAICNFTKPIKYIEIFRHWHLGNVIMAFQYPCLLILMNILVEIFGAI